MELELWPNLIAEAHRRRVPVVVLNGRITEKSFRGFRRARGLFAGTLGRVSRYSVQTEEYAERLRRLGVAAESVSVTGSVKYDAVKTSRAAAAGPAAREELDIASGERVILAGSTHPGEDEALIAACGRLELRTGKPALVLVPRHPERLEAVAGALRSAGLEVVRKTELDSGGKRPPDAVVLVDTMGELGRLYAAADVVFVGGSLVEHGGQNVMEPAGLGKACVFGPHMWNFQEAVDALLADGAARMIGSAEELGRTISEMLEDTGAAARMGEAAVKVIEARKGATRRNVELLAGALDTAGGGEA